MAESEPSKMKGKRNRSLALVLAPLTTAALLTLAACGDKGGAPAAGAGGGMPPPPEVGVVTVQPSAIGLTQDLPGRLEAARIAEVRARASGIVLKRVFTEGSDVKAGQVLYQVDPAPYTAALQSAQATLEQAQANLAQASATATRYRPLVEANAVSKQEYDVAQANEKQARAQVSAGKAAVDSARISLGYASITAPISGRIGRSQVTEGALVGLNDPTPLATIQQVNALYVNLTQSAQEVRNMRMQLAKGQLKEETAKVEILLEDGQVYEHAGKLLFSDLSVDPGTGQVSLRAEVPNPDGMLFPGMYVRVRLEQTKLENAILLPQQSVTRGAKDTVMVVNDKGEVIPRPVKVSGQQNGQWIVVDGLQAGEQVMADGFMKLQFGAKVVKPVPWKAQSAAAPQGAPAASAAASAASAPSGQ